MSVGLMDGDIISYQVPFNLEIMKCAAYYKKKREIVTLAPSFCPDKYSNFIYRKDYNDGIFPANLTKIPNLQYGGLAFSNNRYIALPEEIEIQKIYKEIEKDFIIKLKKQ